MSPITATLPNQLQETSARYDSIWERLPNAIERIMTLTGLAKDKAQSALCEAIADGVMRFRGQLCRHATRRMTSSSILKGEHFEIPATFKSADLDWEASRPTKPWVVCRGHFFSLPGHWHLNWLEVMKIDVTERFGGQDHTFQTAAQDRLPNAAASDPSNRTNVRHPVRRRGRNAKKFNATKIAMLEEIRQGRLTSSGLSNMLEKELSAKYRVSRDTARRARSAVLSEYAASTISTIDK
jgi:hypothetical protein